MDKKVTKHSKGKTKERGSSISNDGDEACEDARDLLSRIESFFVSFSVSGLSGWDKQEVQTFGSFSSDHQQGRDLMVFIFGKLYIYLFFKMCYFVGFGGHSSRRMVMR